MLKWSKHKENKMTEQTEITNPHEYIVAQYEAYIAENAKFSDKYAY